MLQVHVCHDSLCLQQVDVLCGPLRLLLPTLCHDSPHARSVLASSNTQSHLATQIPSGPHSDEIGLCVRDSTHHFTCCACQMLLGRVTGLSCTESRSLPDIVTVPYRICGRITSIPFHDSYSISRRGEFLRLPSVSMLTTQPQQEESRPNRHND